MENNNQSQHPFPFHNFLDSKTSRNHDFSDPGSDHDSAVSDSESGITGPSTSQSESINEGLVKLAEQDKIHDLIKRRFGLLAPQVTISAIYKNNHSTHIGEARLQTFRIYEQATENKNGGDSNVKYAWFGSSKDEINNILGYGFSNCNNICLSPDEFPLQCFEDGFVDEDGFGHLLLCRVILGKSEIVVSGSRQSHPSSEEFDSGVDDLFAPKKFVVWSTHMNTHVLPEYLVRFRTLPRFKGNLKAKEPLRMPTSPWMPFSTLFSVLSKFLPAPQIAMIIKHHKDHRDHKISRHELIKRVRRIAGDKLLMHVIKSFRAQKTNGDVNSPILLE